LENIQPWIAMVLIFEFVIHNKNRTGSDRIVNGNYSQHVKSEQKSYVVFEGMIILNMQHSSSGYGVSERGLQ
jgi:hypothetical protein